MTTLERKLITSLIKYYSHDSGTESLIRYLADTNGMISACNCVFGGTADIDAAEMAWIHQECNRHRISFQNLSSRVSQVLAIFDTSEAGDDHYATLGLEHDASPEEVKAAYRKLCLIYHPDKASATKEYDPQKFINISIAYHAITAPEKDLSSNGRAVAQPDWNSTKKNGISASQKRIFGYWALGLLLVLIVVSVIGTINVKKRAMLAGLTEKRGEAVPLVKTSVESPQMTQSLQTENKIKGEDVPSLLAQKQETEEVSPSQLEKSTVRKSHDQPSIVSERNKNTKEVINTGKLLEEEITKPFIPLVIRQGHAVKNKKELPRQLNPTIVKPVAQNKSKKESKHIEPPNTDPKPLSQTEKVRAGELQSSSHEMSKRMINYEDSVSQKVDTIVGTKDDRSKSEVKSENIQEQIDAFVDTYEKAYAKRNIIAFSRLFNADAIENDKLFVDVLPVYTDLFKTTSEISITIQVLFWQFIDNKVNIEGRFVVDLVYEKGEKWLGKGPITLTLTDNDGILRVQSLRYSFDG